MYLLTNRYKFGTAINIPYSHAKLIQFPKSKVFCWIRIAKYFSQQLLPPFPSFKSYVCLCAFHIYPCKQSLLNKFYFVFVKPAIDWLTEAVLISTLRILDFNGYFNYADEYRTCLSADVATRVVICKADKKDMISQGGKIRHIINSEHLNQQKFEYLPTYTVLDDKIVCIEAGSKI